MQLQDTTVLLPCVLHEDPSVALRIDRGKTIGFEDIFMSGERIVVNSLSHIVG